MCGFLFLISARESLSSQPSSPAARVWILVHSPDIPTALSPAKPWTLKPKPYTRLHTNPKAYTSNPLPYTLCPIPYTLYPMPDTLCPIPWTLDSMTYRGLMELETGGRMVRACLETAS
eukprot:2558040-Rhodomonas_salina.1